MTNTNGLIAPTWPSLIDYGIPEWFLDGKFGIYAHWGLYSVPGFGQEWYGKHMYDPAHPVHAEHVKRFGSPAEFGYKEFIPMFTAACCLLAWPYRRVQRVLATLGATALLVVAVMLLYQVDHEGIQAAGQVAEVTRLLTRNLDYEALDHIDMIPVKDFIRKSLQRTLGYRVQAYRQFNLGDVFCGEGQFGNMVEIARDIGALFCADHDRLQGECHVLFDRCRRIAHVRSPLPDSFGRPIVASFPAISVSIAGSSIVGGTV